jgi:hypothetical protein
VEEVPMLRYMEVLVDWMVDPMIKYSPEASGPITGFDLELGRDCRERW